LWGGDVVKRGQAGSPDSDGASPYQHRGLYKSVLLVGHRQRKAENARHENATLLSGAMKRVLGGVTLSGGAKPEAPVRTEPHPTGARDLYESVIDRHDVRGTLPRENAAPLLGRFETIRARICRGDVAERGQAGSLIQAEPHLPTTRQAASPQHADTPTRRHADTPIRPHTPTRFPRNLLIITVSD
jgi:hypothetical protein